MSRTIDIVARAMAAKAGSGSEGKQDRLVSGENIQYINGHDILGPGNLAIRTWQEFNPSWPTTGLTKSLCDAVNADPTAVVGMGYMGEVTYSDLPFPGNAEIQVEVYKGTGTSGKVIHLVCTSGNVAPYRWEATYWNNGTNYSGWQAIGGGSVNDLIIDKTWAQLKALRDNGELIPGMKYRLTNYTCTTEWPDTQSAGHDFYIILTALSNKELSEDAKADYLENDTYFIGVGSASFLDGVEPEDVVVHYMLVNDQEDWYIHEPTFNEMGTDNGTIYLACEDEDEGYYDKYLYAGRRDHNGNTYDAWECTTDGYIGTKVALTDIITEATMVKIADLPAWQLKYCLDNDKEKFAWAQPGDSISAIKVKNSGNTTYIYKSYPERSYTEDTPKGPLLYAAYALVNNSTNINFDQVQDWDDVNTNNVIWIAGSATQDTTKTYTKIASRRPKPHGFGVIYWMKDEHNNEAPYDFKNIQFKRYKVTRTDSGLDFINQYIGVKEYYSDGTVSNSFPTSPFVLNDNDFIWCYTFDGINDNNGGEHYDFSTIQVRYSNELIESLHNDGTGCCEQDICYNNTIKELHQVLDYDDWYNKKALFLNNIVLKGIFWEYTEDLDFSCAECYSNHFDTNCRLITVAEGCYNNIYGYDVNKTVMGSVCHNNEIKESYGIMMANGNCNTTIDHSYNINIGAWCGNNSFANSNGITFGHSCEFNTFYGQSFSITLGVGCSYNIFDNGSRNIVMNDQCRYMSVGQESHDIIIVGSYSRFITIGPNCSCLNITSDDTVATANN